MAPFFRKKSPMQKLETELASLCARAETLSNRHAAADAAFVDAKSKLRRHHLEADLDADEKAGAKLEAAVATCALTRDGYADALGDVQNMIADIEQKLANERAAAHRKAASEELARNLDEIERALPDFLTAARGFADALEGVAHFHWETGEMVKFVRSGQAQVEIAAAMALQELRGMVTAIFDGAAPIPPRKPEPEPVVVVEPAPETRRLFALRAIKWRDANGRQRHGLQFEDHELTPAAAQRGLRIGAVVPLTDPRRKQLLGSRGGHHVDPNSRDLLDLDDEEATRPPHIAPVLPSDPLASADFRVIDRSAEARVLKIAVPRL
jgi:hypothetical protein